MKKTLKLRPGLRVRSHDLPLKTRQRQRGVHLEMGLNNLHIQNTGCGNLQQLKTLFFQKLPQTPQAKTVGSVRRLQV